MLEAIDAFSLSVQLTALQARFRVFRGALDVFYLIAHL